VRGLNLKNVITVHQNGTVSRRWDSGNGGWHAVLHNRDVKFEGAILRAEKRKYRSPHVDITLIASGSRKAKHYKNVEPGYYLIDGVLLRRITHGDICEELDRRRRAM